MAVDPNIKKKADDIRNKIYGKEVRESLASGLEAMSSDVVENEGRQSVVESRQDIVESQFQDVIENTTDKDVISAPEIIAARDGEANLKARLDKEKNEITAQLTQKTHITPDDFEGTDGEKIKQAIYKAVEDEVYTVNLTRIYDLTGETIDIEEDTFWFEVTLVGGTIVKNDDGFIFVSSSNTRRHNSPHFKDTHFYGSVGKKTYIFNGDHFIRQNMTKCRFRMISLVETTGHIQTLRLLNCETNHHQADFIKADNGYDIKVIGHRGEESSHVSARFMNIVTAKAGGVSYIDLQIKDSLFEGYVYSIPFLLGSGYNLQFEGNYFEANLSDIEFSNPVGTLLITGSITNNIFNHLKGDIHILFSDDNFTVNNLVVEKNTLTSANTKTLTNRSLGITNLDSNTRTQGARLTTYENYTRDSNTLPVTHLNVSGHSQFEVKLPLNSVGTLNQYKDNQLLVNINFNFSNSSAYKGHLLGIISIDSHVVSGQVNSQLMMSVLSTRNTSGNPNGFLDNPEEYSIYFKETDTDSISYTAREVTIVIDLPNSVYKTTNYINIKNINGIMQRYLADYD